MVKTWFHAVLVVTANLLNIVCKHDQDHVYVVLTVIHETIVITNIEKSSLFCKSICLSNFQQIFIKIPSRSLAWEHEEKYRNSCHKVGSGKGRVGNLLLTVISLTQTHNYPKSKIKLDKMSWAVKPKMSFSSAKEVGATHLTKFSLTHTNVL